MTATTGLGNIPGPVIIEQPDPDTFSGRLEIVRRHKNLTGRAMAECLGYSPATFATWLHGATPSGKDDQLSVCERIAEELDVNYVWMCGGPKWAEQIEKHYASLYAGKSVTLRYPAPLWLQQAA